MPTATQSLIGDAARESQPGLGEAGPRGSVSPRRCAVIAETEIRKAAKTVLRADLVRQIDHRYSRLDADLTDVAPTELLHRPLGITSQAELDFAVLDLLADAESLARTAGDVSVADLQDRLAEIRTERDLRLATSMASLLMLLTADRQPRLAIAAADAVLRRLPLGLPVLPRGQAAIANQALASLASLGGSALTDEDRQTLDSLLAAWAKNRQCVLVRATCLLVALGVAPSPTLVNSAIGAAGMQGLRQMAQVLMDYRSSPEAWLSEPCSPTSRNNCVST